MVRLSNSGFSAASFEKTSKASSRKEKMDMEWSWSTNIRLEFGRIDWNPKGWSGTCGPLSHLLPTWRCAECARVLHHHTWPKACRGWQRKCTKGRAGGMGPQDELCQWQCSVISSSSITWPRVNEYDKLSMIILSEGTKMGSGAEWETTDYNILLSSNT